MRIFMLLFSMVSFSFVLTGCDGQENVLDVGEFAPYVSKFEALSNQYGNPVQVTNLIIHYGEMQTAQERAVCVKDGENTPTITVRQDTWAKMSEAEREELLFHEMGHCVLNRHHNPTITQTGLPASIMNPYIISGPIYQNNQDYYLRELFQAS